MIGYVTAEIGGITFGLPDAPSIVPDQPDDAVGAPAPAVEA